MKLYRFDSSAGKKIENFGSQRVSITPLMRIIESHS